MASSIEDLEERLNTFEASLLQMAENLVPQTAKVDETANKVEQITPYKATKTAYIGDTEVVFEDAPMGNVSVFGMPSYQIERISNNIIVTFDSLDEVTTVTISIQ